MRHQNQSKEPKDKSTEADVSQSFYSGLKKDEGEEVGISTTSKGQTSFGLTLC